ncbi:hypothetical protein BJV85_003178 [Clostridium acetobutylicum]|uniref:histidine kinase n=1 Tax=Clostridium acetobutylicum (strain ATCC 824 / DSM 792 / JCM 1419 / IAM 19013 / LMG 5710 / NBRC 13948 / NRRL B-527 / VKM B-1787 / 2291 / W) TaxID=272562 RepID=Q97KT5_CLOAB|nr:MULTISPECIES: ATP-binding protein [Clostridium]AAK78807.1 Sensory transduction histidine kinase [Clostridium acetobutylicum ATCC 824]ADZ19881.1 Sensory transduction histidine kinase [Clostridium acetobutylicum EA 2018]AEI31463.1 sensory transduction histidine kinase [Clostridium acetobutylicum DSM 1731]AWV80525.1 GHKL domain-containing protein [Clostridium acetobutylicum]MBC2392715.1 HAMP domain-containing protein [Clostridium acetobutylicum]
MSKQAVYKIELKIFGYFILILMLSTITVILMLIVKNALEEVLIRYNENTLMTAKFLFCDVKKFSIVMYFFVFVIWSHLLLKRKVQYFINLSESTSEIAKGNFKVIIPVKREDEFGNLAKGINEIVEKFNFILKKEKEIEKTKIDLITNVSHDLRTPLTSILGYLELVENDQYKDEVALWYYIDIAYNKTKRLKVLIDDLFQLTTLNEHSMKLCKKEINIAELLKQLIGEYMLNFQKAGIRCRLKLTDEKLYVLGDAVLLIRAFENIIINCIKYSKTSEIMDVSVQRKGDMAVLNFINYGEPIPAIDIPYIFQRFYRVDKSRSDKLGGSGLGLAIAKNIIDITGGNIEVESDTTRTNFKIVLPCYGK